jgi:integrase
MLQSSSLKNDTALQVPPRRRKPVKMRIKGNRYYGYTTIKDPDTGKSRQIEFSLDAYVGDRDTALENLGEKLGQIRRGELPTLIKIDFQQASVIWKKNPVCSKEVNRGNKNNILILDKTLVPFFGKYCIKDISKDIVKQFHHFREENRIKRSTLDKERRVLKWVMQSVLKSFELPYWQYKYHTEDKYDVPSYQDVVGMVGALSGCSKKYGLEYHDVALVMALTGLDTSDAVNLSRSSFKNGLIVGRRGKTGKRFKIAICSELKALFARRQRERKIEPVSLDASLFDVLSPGSVSKAISRAFDIIGLNQFHAKSLRDFYASILFNAGFTDNFIQDALGQVRGSSETKKYTIASTEQLEKAALTFDHLSIVKKEMGK